MGGGGGGGGNAGLVFICNFILIKPGLSPYSRNNCTTCLLSCSEEGFKAVIILIADICCEI